MWNSSVQFGCGRVDLASARGRGSVCLCGTETDRLWNQFPPVWSRAGRVQLFFAFLHPLPPRAGNGGSSSAMSLGLTPGLLGTAVPTVAVWTGLLLGFPLDKIQKLVYLYPSKLQTKNSSFTVFHLSAPYLFWVSCGPLWGEGCQICGTLCRLQKHFLAPQTRSDIQLWTKKWGLKYLFLFLLAKQNMHIIS